MSEKRFKVCIDNNSVGLLDNSVKLIFIKFTNKEDAVSCKDSLKYQCNLMNELYDENEQLKEENEQLRQMIKENVFGRYAEGSFADLKFKATAYDDIIKLKISNKLVEPKLTVICKRGKKENVQSFCRMFIPHGMYYEIKELEE